MGASRATWRMGVALGGACAFGLCAPAPGQCQADKLLASDGAAADFFGWSVSVHGGVAVAGAHLHDIGGGSNYGAAYVYRRQPDGSWPQEQKIQSADIALGDWFGHSVSVHDDLIGVGAYRDDDFGTNSGSAYVFRRTGGVWAEEAKLLPPAGAADDNFGWSVAVEGEVCVTGAPGADPAGAAYVYRRIGGAWMHESTLTPEGGGSGANFGWSVDVEGSVIVVGAVTDGDSGAAHVFRFDGASWALEQRITPSDGAPGDSFGHAVSLHADGLLVGARYADHGAFNSGAAYIYRENGGAWLEEATLGAPAPAASDDFGNGVALEDNRALVGAPGADETGGPANSGVLFVFGRDGGGAWSLLETLVAADAAPDDSFGWSAALDGGACVIGAYRDDDLGSSAGAAYIFEGVGGPDCNGNGVADACDIAGGASDDTDGNGVPDECERPVDLNGDGAVDGADLALLLGAWGPCPGEAECPADLDGDGDVDGADLAQFLGDWG